MPTEQEIRDWISAIHPVATNSIPPSDRSCPICFLSYLSPDLSASTSYPVVIEDHEVPTRIRSRHPHSTCKHVFGWRCIRNHFRSGGPWSTKCPICREEWFEHEQEEGHWASQGHNVEMGVQARADVNMSAAWEDEEGREFVRMQLPQQIEIRTRVRVGQGVVVAPIHPPLAQEQNAEGTADQDDDANGNEAADSEAESEDDEEREDPEGLDNRGKVNRAIGWLQHILMTGEIDEEDEEASRCVLRVDRAIEKLWQRLEEKGRETEMLEL